MAADDRTDIGTDLTTVAAIVVTYKRPELLLQTLDAVAGQTAPIAAIIVVDNAADAALQGRLSILYPNVFYVPSPDKGAPEHWSLMRFAF